jgi:peptidoglycan/LPS O-acetylase OafA/YrhL
MSSASPRNVVRRNLITLAAMCCLIGMFLMVIVQKSAAQDYTLLILYLLPLPLLFFAAVLTARLILRVVP